MTYCASLASFIFYFTRKKTVLISGFDSIQKNHKGKYDKKIYLEI